MLPASCHRRLMLILSRIRRVKCDEIKPSCRRCTSTGRKCDGYAPDKAKRAPDMGTLMVIAIPTPQVSLARPDCMFRSRESFQRFNELYAPMLSGYGTAGFWNSVVLQASNENEGIKHLVIAASNIACRQLSSLQSNNIAFLSHYGRALKVLGGAHQDVVVVAVACILFALCDELQDRSSSAQRHIQAGQRMLAARDGSALRAWEGSTALNEILSTLSCLNMPRPVIRWGFPLTEAGF